MDKEPGKLYSPWGHKRVEHDLAIKQQQCEFEWDRKASFEPNAKPKASLQSGEVWIVCPGVNWGAIS